MFQIFIFDNKNAAANNGCILKHQDDMSLDAFWEEFTRWTDDSVTVLNSPFKRMLIMQVPTFAQALSAVEKGIHFAVAVDRSQFGVTEWHGLNYFKRIDPENVISATPSRLTINGHEITWREHHKRGDCFSVEVTSNPAKYISAVRHTTVQAGAAGAELYRTSNLAIYDAKETLYCQHYCAASGTDVFKQIGRPAQILGYAHYRQWTYDAQSRMEKLALEDIMNPVAKVLATAAAVIKRYGL